MFKKWPKTNSRRPISKRSLLKGFDQFNMTPYLISRQKPVRRLGEEMASRTKPI